jgi:hypothetical protein
MNWKHINEPRLETEQQGVMMTEETSKLNKWMSDQIGKAREQVHKEYEPMVTAFQIKCEQLKLAVDELKRLQKNHIGAMSTMEKIEALGKEMN